MPARAHHTAVPERSRNRTTATDRGGDAVATTVRKPTPFGATLTPADVLGLQRTAGNRAVARMMAPRIQRELDANDGDVEMADAEAIAAQHTNAVSQLHEKAGRIMDEALSKDGSTSNDTSMSENTASNDSTDLVRAQLDGVLTEADALEPIVERDAERAKTAGGGDPAMDDGMDLDADMDEGMDLDGDADVEDASMSDDASDTIARTIDRAIAPSVPSSTIQRVKKKDKTEKHDRNYYKRARSLTTKLKKEYVKKNGVAQYKISKERDARRKAKAAGRDLDRKDPAKLVYENHNKKSTGLLHPRWKINSASKILYGALRELGVIKEEVRWFQETNASGYTVRSMRASLLPGKTNLMTGSNTAGTSDLYWGHPVLSQRKNSSGSALYIKGHLLNDHLGGAGLAHNLVPLTAEKESGPTNATGSNDANGEHSREVEGEIKKLLMGRTQVKSTVNYRVDSLAPKPDALRLTMTALVRKFAADFDVAVKHPLNAALTTTDLRNGVEAADASFPAGIGQQLMTAINNGDAMAPSVAASLLLDNARLWATEDAQIPAGIECTASYLVGGVKKFAETKSKQSMSKFKIENLLPHMFTAPYRP